MHAVRIRRVRLAFRIPRPLIVFGRVAAACVFALAASANAAGITVDAPEPLRELILKYVDALKKPAAKPDIELEDETEPIQDEQVELQSRARRAREDILPLLETEGYFSAKVDILPEKSGGIGLKLTPGRRTEIREVRIEFHGVIAEEKYAERRKSIEDRWRLPLDKPFRQADWAGAKEALLTSVSERDFAAAKLIESTADIDPIRGAARLHLIVDSGPPFRLGELEVSGLELYSRDLVDRYNMLKPGEPYDYDRLVALQNALQGTPYFSSAIIEIDRDPDKAAATPVRARLTESNPKRLGLSLGYSTNTGLRSEANYRDANIFNRAWELNSSIRLEQKRQSAFADLFFPQTSSGFRDAIGSTALTEDISNLKTMRWAIGATRTRTLKKTEVRVNLNYQRETTEPEGGTETQSKALTLNYGADLRDVDSITDPQSGLLLGFQIGGGAKSLLSDQNFLRLYGRGQYFRPLGKQGTLLLRGEIGYTIASSRDGIPQDFLFRTGGSQSVRGYDYQSLGVTDGSATVGGRTLFISSVEYINWFRPPWGLAVFVDAGNAADEWKNMTLKVGEGFGGRWKSPAGPLGLDLAWGKGDSIPKIHFSIAFVF